MNDVTVLVIHVYLVREYGMKS